MKQIIITFLLFLSFNSFSQNDNLYQFESKKEVLNNSILEISYPFFKNGTYANDINSIIQQKIEEIKSETIDLLNTISPDESKNYLINYVVSVKYLNQKVLSIEFEYDGFTGGAHNNVIIEYININLQNGKKIMINDIVAKEKQDDLFTELIKLWKKEETVTELAEITKEEIFKEGNFFFTEKTLNFSIYQSYIDGYRVLSVPLEK